MTTQTQVRTPLDAGRPRDAATEPVDRWALAALALATLLPSLATSIANVALPTLATTFGAPFHAVQWVVLAYLLAVTSAIVGAGRLGDLHGRRRTLVAGLGLYTAASAAAGLAPGLPVVIAARTGQGLGAAVMMSLALALVGEVVPKARMGRAMGMMGATSAVGTALGPSVGGVLLAWAGWRAIFLVHVPLGLLALHLVRRHLPQGGRADAAHRVAFDHVGTLLLAVTLTAYALAVTTGRGSLGVAQVALLVAAALGAGLFVVFEARTSAPLIRPAMLRDPALGAGLTTSTLVATVVMTTMVVGPFHLSRSLDLDARTLGLVMSVGPLVAALTSVPAGRLVDRFGSRQATLVGLAGMAAGTSALAVVPESFRVAGFLLPIVVVTAGYAVFQTANNTGVMKDVGDEQRGVVSAMLNLSRNLGLVTGASVMGAVFATATGTSELTTAPPEQVAAGMRSAFVVATVLVLVALLVALARRVSVTRPTLPVAGLLAIAVGWGFAGDATAAQVGLDRGEPSSHAATDPAVHAGDAGVWGGQALTVDLRRPGQRVGALVSLEVAERTLGPTWQGTVRPGLGVLGSIGRTDLSLSAGYGFVAAHPPAGTWQVEHRLWQSLQADTRLAKDNPVRLTGRLRVEERALPGSEDFQVRLRLLVRGLAPIGRSGWGISVWDEAFARLNSIDVSDAGFDQNRVFVGPYYQSAGGVRAEIGYVNVLADRKDGVTGKHALFDSHVASLQLTVGLKAFSPEHGSRR